MKLSPGEDLWDYYWDNPDDPNDDQDGTLRTTYAVSMMPKSAGIQGEYILAGSFFPSLVTSVEGTATEIPADLALHGNYPNPFNPSTRIQFDLPERAQVTLQVLDLLGRKSGRIARAGV